MRFKKEFVRKSLHLPGLFFLWLAKDYKILSLSILAILILFYLFSFFLEKRGLRGLPLISSLTHLMQRNGSLDWGPVYLALGILLSLAAFDFRFATLGIVQVCVADGFAAVVGKTWGNKKVFYSPKKSYVGCLAFFMAAFLVQMVFVSPQISLGLALAGTLIESLPFGPLDNLLISVGISFLAGRTL